MSNVTSHNQEPAGFAELLRSPLMLAFGALSLAFAPVLYAYLTQLWTREYYQFFPVAFASTLFLASLRTSQEPDFSGNMLRQSVRVSAILIAVASTIFGCLRSSPWLCYIGYSLLFTLLLDLWKEQDTRRRLLYLALPILMTVRPPLNLDERAVQRLQLITSRIASDFLNVMKIDHIREGNIIQPMTGVPLMVAEACSGVQSLFTVMFIAAAIGVYRQYSIVRTALLMGTAIFWALLMNVGRVLAIAVAQVRFNVDLTTGWKHDAVGYVAMGLAIPFLLSTDRFIQFIFGGIPDDPRKYDRINVFVLAWNWLFVVPEESPEAKKVASSKEATWSALTSGQRGMAIVVAAAVLLTAAPAWVLPGFFRSLPVPPPAIPAVPTPPEAVETPTVGAASDNAADDQSEQRITVELSPDAATTLWVTV